MEKEEIFKKVQALIVDSQGLSPNEVSLDANFKEDLQIDSLELIVLIINAEKEFNCSLPDEKLNTIKTVGDFVDAIYEKKSQ